MVKTSFMKKIHSSPILFDGALGPLLAQMGLRAGDCPETWNRIRPQAVAAIHQAYVQAGAQVITTNSLGANRFLLGRYGLADQVVPLNQRAARIARQTCPSEVYVAGSVGPTGALSENTGGLTFDELVAIFREQIAGLVEGGVDLICVESMSHLHEARAAVTAARTFPQMPVLATMVFVVRPQGFRTTMGVDPQSAVLELAAAGADAIGCSFGQLTVRQMAELVGILRTLTDLPLIARPNAGRARLVGGKLVHSCTPEQLAQGAELLLEAGATMVGGSWGTTPEHIAAMADIMGRARRKKRGPKP